MSNSTGSLAPITSTASGTARTNAINNDDLSWLKSGILAKAANNNVQDVLRDQIQKQAAGNAASSAAPVTQSSDTLTSTTYSPRVAANPLPVPDTSTDDAVKALKDSKSFKLGLGLGDGVMTNGALAEKYGPDWVSDYSIPIFGKNFNLFGMGV